MIRAEYRHPEQRGLLMAGVCELRPPTRLLRDGVLWELVGWHAVEGPCPGDLLLRGYTAEDIREAADGRGWVALILDRECGPCSVGGEAGPEGG